MRRILGYLDGKPQWSDSEPARARVAGYGGSALGHAITVVLTEAQRKAVEGRRQSSLLRQRQLQADWQRRDRAKRKEQL